MLAERFSTSGTLTKCKMHIINRQKPIANKNQVCKNLEHVQFLVGRGQVDFGKEQPLCPVGRKLQLFYFSCTVVVADMVFVEITCAVVARGAFI